MSTEQSIKNNLQLLAKKCVKSLNEKDGVYIIESDVLDVKVTLQPKWVGIEFGVRIKGEELYYHTDTDLYDVSIPDQFEFRETIALDVNAILEALLLDTFLIGEYKKRPSMIIPMHEGAMRIRKGRVAFSGRQYDSVDKARSSGSYSALKLSE